MERILIEDENRNIIIDIQDKVLKGCSFYHDGKIESLKKEDLNIFKEFILSKDQKVLPNEGEYKVVLDNKTGFKHYFLNGVESYIMFFLNNGEDGEVYKVENIGLTDNGWRKEEHLSFKEKIFRLGGKVVHATCHGLMYVIMVVLIANSFYVVSNPKIINDLGPIPILSIVTGSKDIEVNDLIKKIRSSEYLETEDQLFLANKDFLEDIVKYVNSSNYSKFEYSTKFNDISIKTFKPEKYRNGYYRPMVDPNSLYIADNCLTDKLFKNIISHEFIHLCQCAINYNVLTEATAEILSYEYFEDSSLTSYPQEVYLTKKLMEIIGPEPILYYVIGGNFDYISKAIKPYLTDKEYRVFLNDLSRPNRGDIGYNEEEVQKKFDSLDRLLDKVYENKYGISTSDDIAITLLKTSTTLTRYYFNERKIKKEGSYYTALTVKNISLKEAINKGYVYLWQQIDENTTKMVSYEEYMASTYDVNEKLYATTNGIASVCTNENDQLYVVVMEEDSDKRVYLQTLEEKLDALDNFRKMNNMI